MLKFHYMLKKLQLHKEEYVLMQAISLFSPGESCTCLAWLPLALACFPRLAHTPSASAKGGGSIPSFAFPREGSRLMALPSTHCSARMGTTAVCSQA